MGGMLLDFTVTNYRSIYEPTSINMVATREQNHKDRTPVLSKRYKKAVNPIAAIFGPNAAGKSNLISAMKVLQELIKHPPRSSDPMPFDPFGLNAQARNEPTSFEVLYECEGVIYEYIVCFDEERIVEEYLVQVLSKTEQQVFARTRTGFEFSTLSGETPTAVKIATLLGAVPAKVPLASYVGEINFGEDSDSELLRPFLTVRAFFESVLVVPAGAMDTVESGVLGGDWKTGITHIDAGISGIYREEVEPSALGVSLGKRQQFVEELVLNGSPYEVETPNGRFELSDDGGRLVIEQVSLVHETGSDDGHSLSWSEESDGTHAAARLLSLLGFLTADGANRVLLIDEIDRSFHTALCKSLIRSFLQKSGPESRSQLIFTTHDLLLMDTSMLRRDEIWVVEKDRSGQTQATVLSDYRDTRKSTDLRTNYLQGRFGGVPSLDPAELLNA